MANIADGEEAIVRTRRLVTGYTYIRIINWFKAYHLQIRSIVLSSAWTEKGDQPNGVSRHLHLNSISGWAGAFSSNGFLSCVLRIVVFVALTQSNPTRWSIFWVIDFWPANNNNNNCKKKKGIIVHLLFLGANVASTNLRSYLLCIRMIIFFEMGHNM